MHKVNAKLCRSGRKAIARVVKGKPFACISILIANKGICGWNDCQIVAGRKDITQVHVCYTMAGKILSGLEGGNICL